MDNKPLVLIVEDDDTVSNFMASMLSANDYRFIKARSGSEAMCMASSHMPDLILLDMGLPDIDGVQVLKNLRAWSAVPVIIVSARGYEREKVEALDLGADDYITKPFGTHELLARIRTALRHSRNTREAEDQPQKFTVGDLAIDYEKRIVSMCGQEIHFTPIEYKIIMLLSRHAGKVLTHDFIIKAVWGPYASENQALRVNMANIRRKLEANPGESRYIQTEIGVGYRMAEEL